MKDLDLPGISAAAAAATQSAPGQWITRDGDNAVYVRCPDGELEMLARLWDGRDAAYIVATQPSVITALVERLLQAEQRASEAEGEVERLKREVERQKESGGAS